MSVVGRLEEGEADEDQHVTEKDYCKGISSVIRINRCNKKARSFEREKIGKQRTDPKTKCTYPKLIFVLWCSKPSGGGLRWAAETKDDKFLEVAVVCFCLAAVTASFRSAVCCSAFR